MKFDMVFNGPFINVVEKKLPPSMQVIVASMVFITMNTWLLLTMPVIPIPRPMAVRRKHTSRMKI